MPAVNRTRRLAVASRRPPRKKPRLTVRRPDPPCRGCTLKNRQPGAPTCSIQTLFSPVFGAVNVRPVATFRWKRSSPRFAHAFGVRPSELNAVIWS